MLIAVWRGYRKGFVIALFSVFALIVGIAAALKFSTIMADVIENHISASTKWIPTLSFIMVFLLSAMLVHWCGKLIESALKLTLLGWANRLCGALLYMIMYALVFSVLLFYAEKINLFNSDTTLHSKVCPLIEPFAPKLIDGFGKIVPIFKDMFKELETFFEIVKSKLLK